MGIFYTFFMASLILSSSSSYAAEQGPCVADYTAPFGPAGYSCKRPETVTVNDFVSSRLVSPGKTGNVFRAETTPATVAEVPGLNGLGLSMGRVDFAAGGVVPLHTHPRASEVVLVVGGSLVGGFISSDQNNTVYLKTLKKGDIMVFPKGLLHFQVNIDAKPALAFASYSNERPDLQVMDWALFKNNFPTDLINRTTFLDVPEIKKLKAVFGGTN